MVDRRVRRTRRLLEEACIELVLEQGYEGVTVEAIAQRADVGRATFYMHYRDKDDLFTQSIGGISTALHAHVAAHLFAPDGRIVATPVRLIFEHAQANATLYRVVLSGAGNGKGLNQVRRDVARFAEAAFAAEASKAGRRPTVPLTVIAQHFASSLLGLVYWWLEADQPYTVAEMTDMFRQLLHLGRAHIMGLPAVDYEPDRSP